MSRDRRPGRREAVTASLLAALAWAAIAHGAALGPRQLVSKAAPTGLSAGGQFSGSGPAVSADGRFLVFESTAADIVPGQVDGNGARDVFLFDRLTGQTSLVSHVADSPSRAGNGASDQPTISSDGEYVAFRSAATDLVPAMDLNGTSDVYLYERARSVVTLVSRAQGSPIRAANGTSDGPVISGDGSYVAFGSTATNLVSSGTDNNSSFDVFLYARATAQVALVSHVAGDPITTSSGNHGYPRLSQDGRFVIFGSDATDLVAGTDVNGTYDVFLYARSTGVITLVSHVPGSAGTTGDGQSFNYSISADGGYVAFESLATDLVAGTDENGVNDVFLYERTTGVVTLVSHISDQAATAGNGISGLGMISWDGAYVVLISSATDLVEGIDENGSPDVFLYRRETGTIVLVSHVPGSAATSGNATSYYFSGQPISRDRRFLAFASYATDLVSGTDGNGDSDVFLYDVSTGAVTLVSYSLGNPAITANMGSYEIQISENGRVLAFSSVAGDLVASDSNGSSDIFAASIDPAALTVSVAGAGSGTVISAPARISCPPNCHQAFDQGTVVSLTAVPAAGSVFTGWTGVDLDCQDGVLTLTASTTCTASFELGVVLTVQKAGPGDGSVVSSLPGLACGGAQPVCAALFPAGTVLTLTAAVAPGALFGGWAGCDAHTPGGACTLALDGSRTVTATFVLEIPTLTLALNADRFGPGDELVLTGTLFPGVTPVLVDAYVVLELLDGSFLSLTLDGGVLPGLVPIATGFLPVPLTRQLLQYRFTGGEIPGAYAFRAALVEAGTGTVIVGAAGIRAAPFRFSLSSGVSGAATSTAESYVAVRTKVLEPEVLQGRLRGGPETGTGTSVGAAGVGTGPVRFSQ